MQTLRRHLVIIYISIGNWFVRLFGLWSFAVYIWERPRGSKLDLILLPADGAQVARQMLLPRLFWSCCKYFGLFYNLVRKLTHVPKTILFKIVYFDFPKMLWIILFWFIIMLKQLTSFSHLFCSFWAVKDIFKALMSSWNPNHVILEHSCCQVLFSWWAKHVKAQFNKVKVPWYHQNWSGQ